MAARRKYLVLVVGAAADDDGDDRVTVDADGFDVTPSGCLVFTAGGSKVRAYAAGTWLDVAIVEPKPDAR